jgi:hypothetical protein
LNDDQTRSPAAERRRRRNNAVRTIIIMMRHIKARRTFVNGAGLHAPRGTVGLRLIFGTAGQDKPVTHCGPRNDDSR